MGKYVLKRLLWIIPVILGVAALIFTIMFFIPSDPAVMILGSNTPIADLNALREKLGLFDPYIVRLLNYLKDVFLHFNLGNSYVTKIPVITELAGRFPATLIIAVACIGLSIVIGVPLGVLAAVKQDTVFDRLSMFVSLIGVSIPQFWLALLMVILFSLKLGWLPASGTGGIVYFILPCIANSFSGIATQARQARSSMLEVIRADYITTARAKGVSEIAVIFKHALPNALLPLITVAGTNFGQQLAGALIIENVFSIPGIGYYMVNAINNRDYPAVEGSVIVLAIAFSLVMLLTDLIYAYVDPRIKAQYSSKGGK